MGLSIEYRYNDRFGVIYWFFISLNACIPEVKKKHGIVFYRDRI